MSVPEKEVTSAGILDKVHNFLVAAGEEGIIEQITQRNAKAVNQVISRIDPHTQYAIDQLQAIPIALLQKQELLATLFFMEHTIRNGAKYALEIIQIVLRTVFSDIEYCRQDGDTEALEVLQIFTEKLFQVLEKTDYYKSSVELYILLGEFQQVVEPSKEGKYQAIEAYNRALPLNSPKVYSHLADAYEGLSLYDMSATILSLGYGLTGDIVLLERYIRALAKSGKVEEAHKKYQDLLKKAPKDKVINPFIVYKESVHNDDDLKEVEKLFARYTQEASYEPTQVLKQLALAASEYTANQIEREGEIIGVLNDVLGKNWTEEHDREYTRAIKRRLYLMQVHIITLGDHRYIDLYLSEMERYVLLGNTRTHMMMGEYFSQHFSEQTAASYNSIRAEDDETIEKMNVISKFRIHLVQIGAIFSQFSFLELIRDQINPLIQACNELEGSVKEEENDQSEIRFLSHKESNFNSLLESTQRLYEDFIEQIDTTYGMFYRRMIQNLAGDLSHIPTGLKDVLGAQVGDISTGLIRQSILTECSVFSTHPDITLLFYLEQMIADDVSPIEDVSLDELIEQHRFDALSSRGMLLLLSFLYERDAAHKNVIIYIINTPEFLEIPYSIYITTEYLRYADEGEFEDLQKSLDRIVQQTFGDEDFFTYIGRVTQEVISQDELDHEDVRYMLLADANISLIVGDEKRALESLRASKDYGTIQGILTSSEVQGELQKDYRIPLELLQQAYTEQPSIYTLRRILALCIENGKFDEAEEYISLGIREQQDIAAYIAANLLYQGRYMESFEEILRILLSDGELDPTFPEGMMPLLADVTNDILTSPDENQYTYRQKILASYLSITLSKNTPSDELSRWIEHIHHIERILTLQKSPERERCIIDSLKPITGEIEFEREVSDIEAAMCYTHLHTVQIHQKMVKIHEQNQANHDREGTENSFHIINEFLGKSILMLTMFPESEKYTNELRQGINLFPIPGQQEYFWEQPRALQ